MSEKDLAEANGHFPHALVAHADTLEEVIEEWRDAGLEPVEVSEEDLTSEITISATRHDGALTWEARNADGIRALGLMSVAMRSMFHEYVGGSGRHKLQRNTPDTKILINLADGNLQLASDHKQDGNAVAGVLMACLWKLLEQAEEAEHPLDKFTGLLNFDVEEE